MHKPSTRK